MSLSVEIAERCAALYPHYAVMRIYADASHVREIDNDSVIAVKYFSRSYCLS